MTRAIVVPCFNEAQRLDTDNLVALAKLGRCHVLVVDDGSTDGTADTVAAVADREPLITVLRLTRNRGKAEAVRAGLNQVIAHGHDLVGYCDADFAAPAHEIARLLDFADGGADVVLGSRVALLGHHVERSLVRHYTGRVFGTLTSLVLGVGVYDTQCGAKVFRATDHLAATLALPFVSRWSFDVELLGRLLAAADPPTCVEVPLLEWRDVAGSKLNFVASLRSTADLLRIRRSLTAWRSAAATSR